MTKSYLEELLAWHIKACALPEPIRQHRFMPGRRFQFDFAWPERMLAAEVDGGTWSGGRHVRGAGVESDSEKYSLAAIRGWRVLRFTSTMVYDGRALLFLRAALEHDEKEVKDGGN